MGWWRRRRPARPVAEGIDAHYRRLVARNGKQTWTPEDERQLAAKVRRLQKKEA